VEGPASKELQPSPVAVRQSRQFDTAQLDGRNQNEAVRSSARTASRRGCGVNLRFAFLPPGGTHAPSWRRSARPRNGAAKQPWSRVRSLSWHRSDRLTKDSNMEEGRTATEEPEPLELRWPSVALRPSSVLKFLRPFDGIVRLPDCPVSDVHRNFVAACGD
jgi:hypothetical protein